MISQIVPEGLIQHPDIPELFLQQRVFRGLFQHMGQLLLSDIVLHEFRKERFDFVQTAGAVHLAAQVGQIPGSFLGQFPQHHAFSRVGQDGAGIAPHLLEHPVGQALEAQHIDIQDALARGLLHHGPLGLHGELLRHNDIIKYIRVLFSLPDDGFECVVRLARSGASEDEL